MIFGCTSMSAEGTIDVGEISSNVQTFLFSIFRNDMEKLRRLIFLQHARRSRFWYTGTLGRKRPKLTGNAHYAPRPPNVFIPHLMHWIYPLGPLEEYWKRSGGLF